MQESGGGVLAAVSKVPDGGEAPLQVAQADAPAR